MADYAETVLSNTAALRAPISEGAPGGADVSFDPAFESMKAEIDKLSDMGGATPDWKSVQSLATEILTSKAKDFRAAIWLSTARVELSGWTGWAESLTVVNTLATEYWDTMFPEARRARARANLFGWMLERVKTKVESLPIKMADGDAVRHCDAMLDSVDGILAEKVGDAWGGLGEMRSVMRARVRDIPEPPPPPPPAPEPSAETSDESTSSGESYSQASSSGGSLPSVSSPEEVDDALLQLGQAIMGAAAVLRESDATDATAYRLQRVGAWLPIRMLPPAEGVTTMVPGPDTSILDGFAALAAAQAWAGIVGQAERAGSESLFWLDVHRWTAFALDRMGATEARAALGREVVGFVSRLPGIERLCFSDGTPFADAATKGWLDEERATYGGGGGGGGATRDPLDAGLEDAETKAQAGQLNEALVAVIPLANGIGDPRRRFEIKTRVARIALSGGRNDVARAMLEGLVGEADKHQLETWEPALCVPVLRSLIQCYVQLGMGGPDERGPGRRAELFDRLCRIDASAAASVELG